jgi:hypothetical protein
MNRFRVIPLAVLLAASSEAALADFDQATFLASIWARSNYGGPPFPPPQWNGGDFTNFGATYNNATSSSLLGVTASASLHASQASNLVTVIASATASSSEFQWPTWAEGTSVFRAEYDVPAGGRWRYLGSLGQDCSIVVEDLRSGFPVQFQVISGPANLDTAGMVLPSGGRFRVTFTARAYWQHIGQPPVSASMNMQMSIIPPPPPPPAGCDGDADGNNTVNFQDMTAVLANFNAAYTVTNGAGDADHNMVVNFADITRVLSRFNTGCQ